MECSPLLRKAFEGMQTIKSSVSEVKPGLTNFDDYIKSQKLQPAIQNYSDSGYKEINKAYLRGEVLDPEFNKLFDVKGEYAEPTYRATHLHSNKLSALQKGDMVETNMVLSTTKEADRNVYHSLRKQADYSDKSKVVLEMDNSLNPQYDIADHSLYPDEQEVLVAPKSILRVMDIVKEGGITTLKVQTLPNIDHKLMSKKNKITNLMSLTGGAILIDREAESQ